MIKYFATALLTTSLFTCAASAQTASYKTAAADSAAANRVGSNRQEWRASKLVGVNVYNDANEKIGEINDMILDKSGKVEKVILGVGGFLGMGEHYVAVGYDELRWSNEPPRSTTASTAPSTTNRPATSVNSNAHTAADGMAQTKGGATTAEDGKADGYWYPDHAIYDATKDRLKSMPQFKY